MAELCARQGRTADAVGIYRRLLSERGSDDRRAKWAARLAALEGAATAQPPAGVARSRSAGAGPARRPAPGDDPPEEAPDPMASVVTPAPTLSPAPAPSSVRRLPLFIQTPVRSGQVVYAEDRDLIVMAGVNPGAQLIADGHIHVYGALRGRAVAGAHGWLEARIFCQRLEAELVGIDAAYVTSDDLPRDRVGKTAQVLSRDGRCVVLPL